MDNNNSYPFVTPPEHSGKAKELGMNRLAIIAKILGVIAFLSTVTLSIYPGIVLGATAVVAAYLSRGGELRFHRDAKKGMGFGVVALIINISILILVLLILFTDNPMRTRVDEVFRSMYNMSLDDFLSGNGNIRDFNFNNISNIM